MKFVRSVVSLVAVSAIASSVAYGQATRTWVSGVGDDANPCSRTAPCKTWAGAISKTATGGEIDNLDAGGFGALTITKSITVDGGGGGMASSLVSGTPGMTIAAGTTGVVILRNLNFQGITQSGSGGTTGISIQSAAEVHIEHCAIMGFNNDGIDVTPSSQPAAGTQVFIVDTVSQNNGGYGLYINASSSAINAHVAASGSHFNGNGLAGVDSADYSRSTVFESEANGNGGQGFLALANSGTVILGISNSMATNNSVNGIQAGGGTALSTIRVSGTSLYSNVVGFATGTNGIIDSFGNNSNAGSGTPTATIALQ